MRRAAAEAAQAVSGLEVDAARVGAERDDVRARLPDDTEPAQLDVAAAEELESTLGRLERRREQLGQVNPLAAEELEEEKARLAELTEQREDLEPLAPGARGVARRALGDGRAPVRGDVRRRRAAFRRGRGRPLPRG